MSYEPTNWEDGDTITTARLNKIEQGIAEGSDAKAFVVNAINQEEEEIVD